MNAMKKTNAKKKLIPAAAMLAISAAMLSTATYAWFTMSKSVTVTGMQVKAEAEKGLLVINELDTDSPANWNTSATASYNTVVPLLPTSTDNVTDWYYKQSSQYNDAEANQAASAYTTLSDLTDTKASVNDGAFGDGEHDYYLLNKFYIKSSAGEITDKELQITTVTATGTSASGNLDASLRVAIKINNKVFIYYPVSGATTQYHVGGYTGDSTNQTWAKTVNAVDATNGTLATPSSTALTTIPANSTAKASAIEADVYLYFEGEDANCKSSNITSTLDNLSVSVSFGLAD